MQREHEQGVSDARREQQGALNQFIREHGSRIRSQEEVDAERTMRDFDQKIERVGLDQGSRGGGHDQGAHAPEPKPTMSDMLRRMRHGSD
jgi:hypothetical protein